MPRVTVVKGGRVVIQGAPFRPSDRVEVFASRDTLVLKRVKLPTRLSDIARRAPGRAMPLQAIVREIRTHRRERSG